MNDALKGALKKGVRSEIGGFAAPDVIHWATGLPKTRSGKIMRRILRKIAANKLDELVRSSEVSYFFGSFVPLLSGVSRLRPGEARLLGRQDYAADSPEDRRQQAGRTGEENRRGCYSRPFIRVLFSCSFHSRRLRCSCSPFLLLSSLKLCFRGLSCWCFWKLNLDPHVV